MSTTWRTSILFAGVMLLGARLCDAQSAAAQIAGRITDSSNAVIPSANITVTNEETGVKRDTVSNDTGSFAVPLLPPGTYRIAVQKEGFRPVAQSAIVLQVDQVTRLDFVLEVGAISEQVEVRESAPMLSQESSSLGQVVDNSKVVKIPLNGRSPFRLVLLMPGVVGFPSANGQFGDVAVNTQNDSNYSINGGQAHNSEILIDGMPSTVGPTTMTTIPTVDSTREFKVESNNLSAEFGRFSGGVVNVSTRSGTNALHGTLFEFLRNSATDANDFFNNAAGLDRAPFRMNQFGAAVGGPVAPGRLYNGHSRTFFFADYQGTRWARGDVYTTTMPTAAERAGNFTQTLNAAGQVMVIYEPVTTRANPAVVGQFIRDPFPGNVLPTARIDPVARRTIEYYPAPNVAGDPVTHANNYLSNSMRTVNKDEYSGRVDHNVTNNYRLFGKFDDLGKPPYEEDEHAVGEIWCAALMQMNRNIGAALGSKEKGHELGWQIVVDGMKLTAANPNFLDARDGILKALDGLNQSGKLAAGDFTKARKAAWVAFAQFGMAAKAKSNGASLSGVIGDSTLPAGV